MQDSVYIRQDILNMLSDRYGHLQDKHPFSSRFKLVSEYPESVPVQDVEQSAFNHELISGRADLRGTHLESNTSPDDSEFLLPEMAPGDESAMNRAKLAASALMDDSVVDILAAAGVKNTSKTSAEVWWLLTHVYPDYPYGFPGNPDELEKPYPLLWEMAWCDLHERVYSENQGSTGDLMVCAVGGAGAGISMYNMTRALIDLDIFPAGLFLVLLAACVTMFVAGLKKHRANAAISTKDGGKLLRTTVEYTRRFHRLSRVARTLDEIRNTNPLTVPDAERFIGELSEDPASPEKITGRDTDARQILATLDQEWLEYEQDPQAYFLTQPVLRDMSVPVVMEYHDLVYDLREAVLELDGNASARRSAEIDLLAEKALIAWHVASDYALSVGISDRSTEERVVLRRLNTLVERMADPAITRAEFTTTTSMVEKLIAKLHTVPVTLDKVLELPMLESVRGRVILEIASSTGQRGMSMSEKSDDQ